MKPLFIYDGDCDFCHFWVERWRRRTGGRVEYEPYQKLASQFPSVPKSEFARAAKLVEPTGEILSGAAAVFKLWTYRSRLGNFWWWGYRHIPLFAPLTEWVYRLVARHRPFFWWLTKLLLNSKFS